MSKLQVIILVLTTLLVNCGAFYLIRDVIWSIVWCDKGGKYNALVKVKKGQSIVSKFKMRYLKNYVSSNMQPFLFWLRVMDVHVCVTIMSVIVGIICIFLYRSFTTLADTYCFVYLFLSLLELLCVGFQFDINRDTKYDRQRIEKRNKRK